MEVEDFSGQRLPDFELVVGEDILESNIGTLIVSYDEVEDAVVDYIRNVYPEIHDYMIDIESY
jgi:hypothetical protein